MGSISGAEESRLAIEAGANFLVCAFVNLPMMDVAASCDVPAIPGASTLTEVVAAEASGASLVKLFPASRLGGPAFVRDILAPMPNLKLMATGGIAPGDVREYLEAGCKAVGIGGRSLLGRKTMHHPLDES
jgi:2-dehydro-3-deoxyphosphogluconate aldolase/(4S)-4-hydroxy-2-oxoglutarate aldolase